MSKLGFIARHAVATIDLSAQERKVFGNMARCQTAAMGYNQSHCEACGHQDYHYNSCRDRHCPLCQGFARARWVSDRLDELLPCPYFHVVFTVPKELQKLAQAHKRVFFRCLFASVHASIQKAGNNEANLGGQMGGFSVLHTWNQKLAFHPHVHCIIPGGAFDRETNRWIPGNPAYLLPTRQLATLHQGILLSRLEEALERNEFEGSAAPWVQQQLDKAARKDWLVYAKAPFGGPEQVVKYLGRYTHRVGISEERIVSCNESTVRFSWLDRAHGHSRQIMTLTTRDFAKKFSLHLLPRGLRKIRHFGFMGNRERGANLNLVRELIGPPPAPPPAPAKATLAAPAPVAKERTCPNCGAAVASRKIDHGPLVLRPATRPCSHGALPPPLTGVGPPLVQQF